MAEISEQVVKLKNTIRKLDPVMDSVGKVSDIKTKLSELVKKGVLTNDEAKDMLDQYKQPLKDKVSKIIQEEAEAAKTTALAGKLQANQAMTSVVPVINGFPSMAPPVTSNIAENAAVLAEVPGLVTNLADKLNTINSSLA